MKSDTGITPASLELPEVQLMDCGQHLLHIVGQITLTVKLIPGANRKVKVLINGNNTQNCLLGTNPQEALGLTLILPDEREIPKSPVTTVEGPSKESTPPSATASSTLTVRLLKTCRIPGY